MVLGGWPPGRVGSCWIIGLSLLTKSFLVQIYTCHEKSPSTKAYPRSRATFRGKYAKSRHICLYRTQKLSLITLMVLGGWPPGRVGSCWIIGLSLLTKSFLVQIYTCHEKSPSTKAYPRSRATFRGKYAKSRHICLYRTQKLSLITLMVLGGWPPGRVGSC